MAAAKTEQKAERVIALIVGESGAGKSFFLANLKKALIFDTDIGGGLSAYEARIRRNGSELIQVSSYPEVMVEIGKRKAANTLKDFTTIALDHLTTLQQEAVARHNPTGAEDFGKSYAKATKDFHRLRELVRTGDFNLFCTAHMKAKYVDNKPVGFIPDASKNVEADMTMVVYLEKSGKHPSTARVDKWRRDPEDERGLVPARFPFTVEEFRAIHGFDLDGTRHETPMATPEHVAELVRLLSVVKLEEGTEDAWKKKAKVEEWIDMTEAQIVACINHLNKIIAKGAK